MNKILEESIELWDKKTNDRKIIIDTLKKIDIRDDNTNKLPQLICEGSDASLSSNFYVIAEIYPIEKKYIWIWEWALPHNNNYTVKFSMDIFKYGQTLNSNEYTDLKNLLINSRFIIDNSDHIVNVYISLISFILKNPYVDVMTVKNKSIVFCLEKDKVDKYVSATKKK